MVWPLLLLTWKKLGHKNGVKLTVESLDEVDDLIAVPQLDENVHLAFRTLGVCTKIFCSIKRVISPSSLLDAEYTTECPI